MTYRPHRHPMIPEKSTDAASQARRTLPHTPSPDPLAATTPTRLARERQAFHVITAAAVSEAALPDIAKKILGDLLQVLDFDSAVLRLYDPAAGMLNLTAYAGRRVRAMMDKFPSQSIDDPHYLSAFVAREGTPVFAPAIQEHPIAMTHFERIQELGLEGVIAYPIANASGQLIGVVALNARHKRQINPGDRTFFEAVARMFGTIIEHRQAVDALRESEAQYRSLFENAPAALWVEDFSEAKVFLDRLRASGVADLATHLEAHPEIVTQCAARIRILDVNRQALALYQATDKAALLAGLPQILTSQAYKTLARELLAIDAGATWSTTEVEHRTLTGELRQLIMQWFVAPGHESDYGRVFVSFLNVTETRALEAQLLQSQKMESIGTLAGGIAHDFNNIMQTISGYTQLMLWDRAADDADIPHLRAIEKAAERASRLTRKLLTFSRKVPFTLSPVNLNIEIKNVCNILKRTIPKMIRIECRLAPDLALVDADRSQIEQVLMNLGVNASHAMPEGGRLMFETRNVEVLPADVATVNDVGQGPQVLIRVADTGHGMDPQTRQRIFEPFFTTRDVGQGSGLGLAMVYGILQDHHGCIACRSEPGKGTCFELYLPARHGAPRDRSLRVSSEAMLLSGTETILVVDDEPLILDLAETLLTRHGYQVLRAADGEEALAIMSQRRQAVHLVLLDVNMPGMGGQSCLAALRAGYPEVPVLLASGYSANQSAPASLAAGAAGFIGKPYQLEEMLRMVRGIIDGRGT